MKSKYLLLLLSLVFCFSSCSSRATIEDAFTISRGAKKQALDSRLDRFNRALYWGGMSEAMTYVDEKYQRPFLDEQREWKKDQKIVRSEIALVELDQLGDKADVEIEIRYYAQPTYLVLVRREQQKWKFERYDGGWLLYDRSVVEGNEPEQAKPNLGLGRESEDFDNF